MTKKYFGPKIFFDQNFFGTKEVFDLNFFKKTFFTQNFFDTLLFDFIPTFLGPNHFGTQNLLDTKSLGPKTFWTQFC